MSAQILIIEDNLANLELMIYLLKAFGYDVSTAEDGSEGLAVARSKHFDLVISDVHLPTLSGYEVAKRMKRDHGLKSIPIIAVTALAMVGDRDKVLAAGFDGYIAKPITPEVFVQQVEQFLHPERHSRTSPAPQVASPSGTRDTADASGPTILVVDDSDVNISLMHSILEPFGYRVIAARSVEEGIRTLEQTTPDSIVSDVHLEDGTGYELLRYAKSENRLRDTPFLFLSSTGGRQSEKQALELGARKYLVRPIEPEILLAEISAVLPAF